MSDNNNNQYDINEDVNATEANIEENATEENIQEIVTEGSDNEDNNNAKKRKKQSTFKMYLNSLKADWEVEKATMSEMETKRERFGYFLYYHKWQLLVACICLIAIIYLSVSLIFSKNSIYYALVINDSYNDEFATELEKELGEVISYNPSREKINVSRFSTDTKNYDPGYYGGDAGMQGVFSLMMDNLIDTMIAEQDELAWFAKDNNYCNLKEVLPPSMYTALEDKMIYLEDSSGDAMPYAIDLTDTKLLKDGKAHLKNPGIAIYATSTHLEDDINAIKYIFDYKDN